MWAGLSWWGGLAWVVALIAVSIAGGRESNEELVLYLTLGSGTIVSIALTLAGYLIGRRNADWWRPRLKEMLPRDADATDSDRRTPQRVSQKSSARREKHRSSMAQQVRSQIREARIYERRGDGNGTLLSEPILVVHRSRDRTLYVFDQEGNEMGRVVRVLHSASKAEGSVWIAELRDTHGHTVLALRLAPRRRRLKHAPVATGSYAICSADGKHLATIGPPEIADKRSCRTATAGGQLLAHIEEESKLNMTVADADRGKIADIGSPVGFSAQSGWYVVNRTDAVEQPLSGVILAACIVWDDTRTDGS
jgi:hypothetical protein